MKMAHPRSSKGTQFLIAGNESMERLICFLRGINNKIIAQHSIRIFLNSESVEKSTQQQRRH